jgi:glutamate formiminotransferase/formiminotetrahydrofolate cyclodeaminase
MMGRSNELATEDSTAFDRVMEGFGLPKTTVEEKSERKDAIRSATLEAAVVPFETASLAFELLTSLPELALKGNGNAVTDVGVAGLLASAAAKGAIFNVEINLDSLPEEMGQSIRKELPSLKEHTRIASRAVMDAVRERMGQ